MTRQTLCRFLSVAVAVSAMVFGTGVPALQAQAPKIRYLSGQNIQPAFEGWELQKDGSYDLVFSYLNRSLAEEVIVPIGRDNNLEPGGPDRGQPTFFYPGRREFVFRVNVPKDFGKNELVWTLTVRGSTLKAVASLLPVWEINRQLIVSRTVPQARLDTVDKNQPPSLIVDPVADLAAPGKTALRATVTDDGIPGPKPARGQRPQAPPVFMNAPLPAAPGAPPPGLSLNWIQYRGPATVTFAPAEPKTVESGQKSEATVEFPEPGVYELRAVANDSILETTRNITVTVGGPAAPH
jgi:hypothetical protein